MNVLVYIQQDDGVINSISMEALKGAQEIAKTSDGTLTAVVFNEKASHKLKKYDISKILEVKSDQLDNYNPINYTSTLENIIKQYCPDIIVFGHTYEARDWVPRLSARLDIPFVSDCIGYKIENDLVLTRSIYQGKFNSDVSVKNSKLIISFQSGAFRSDSLIEDDAIIEKISMNSIQSEISITTEDKFKEQESSVDLSQANSIVAVGRGIGKEEHLQIIKDLADTIGAEIASSRPVVDSGWLAPYHQVGSSGQSVAPKLYFALGISGAIQHVVGMKSSKNIIVINKDKNAPIFEIADYGVVGDLFDIIPNLITSIKEKNE